jgi:hypothetical protein
MAQYRTLTWLSALTLILAPAAGFSQGLGHHGGMIIHCTDPVFLEENPGKDAMIGALEKFSVTASDNTDGSTVKAWVNNKPVPVVVTPQLSGRLTITATLQEPLTQGRAWIKVTGTSHDGCDQLHTWNVYAGN